MPMRTELSITYDRNMHPLSAKCKGCGEQMGQPGPELKEPVDIILWYSQLYVEHRKLKHAPAPGPAPAAAMVSEP
jgi:hypothetical protein